MTGFLRKKIIALGFFDCVHYAHRLILQKTRECAKACNAESAVITFSDNVKNSSVVYDYEERVALLSNLCDSVITFDFTDDFKNTSAKVFLEMLVNDYGAAGFVCGYDNRFGKGAEGDCSFLENFAKENALECSVLDRRCLDGQIVSTTNVKNFLVNGEIEAANKMLVVPYHITQKVLHGRGQGHLFGFPTINFCCKNHVLLPKPGVYSTMCDIDGILYKSVTNVGNKPTFKDETVSVETFIQNFSDDIYDKTVTVYFGSRLRDIQRFDSPDELKKQIYEDIRR